MKRTRLLGLFLIGAMITACGGEDEKKEKTEATQKDIEGKWKIVKYESDDEDNEKMIEMGMVWDDCEYDNVFEFQSEPVGKTDDGIETMKLVITNGSCEDSFKKPGDQYEDEWGLSGSKLFIRHAFIGGISRSGGFEVASISEKKMVLKHMGAEITFERM